MHANLQQICLKALALSCVNRVFLVKSTFDEAGVPPVKWSTNWAYAEEFRKWEDLEAEEKENGHYFASFSEALVLKQVILGHRCETTRAQLAAV